MTGLLAWHFLRGDGKLRTGTVTAEGLGTFPISGKRA